MTHVFNSIGSNIFLELGEDTEIRLKNGKKRQRKQWSIWLGNASWRITKNGKYLVGSVDARENIEQHLRNMLEKNSAYIVGYLDGDQQNLGVKFQELVGSRMIHVKYSPSKDATFTFDNQYVLTTFINRHLS